MGGVFSTGRRVSPSVWAASQHIVLCAEGHQHKPGLKRSKERQGTREIEEESSGLIEAEARGEKKLSSLEGKQRNSIAVERNRTHRQSRARIPRSVLE